MDIYVGNMFVLGSFIKKHYNSLYTEVELEKIEDDEMYQVDYYEVPEETKCHPCFAVNNFRILDINNEMKTFTFNTSSMYALELCGYDFNEYSENEDE